ncbi:MAG: flagellar filament capping protein FliD [Lachnospiraceae bacterium]|nr:flagellar filament capping protein FliD [Lachnospiraceae bacterium]
MPIRMSGMVSNLDTDAIIKEMMSAQSLKKTAIEQKKTKLDWKKEKWEEMNTKIYSMYTEKLSSLKLQGSYLTKKATSSNESKAKATATSAAAGSYSLKIDSLASAEFVTGADISGKELKESSKLIDAGMAAGQTISIRTGKDFDKTTEITVDEDTTVKDFIQKLKDAGLNASFDSKNGRFFISAKESGVENGFSIESNVTGSDGLEALGLGNIDSELAGKGQVAADKNQMAIVGAKDASIVLNGAVISSTSNTVQANGLTLELIGTTEDAMSITVGNDTDAVYDKVKDFVKSYNELLDEMTTKYNAASARKYAMLTDDEKEAMSEDQVKLWEDKIKDSLLRNDDTLNSLIQTFRSAMQEGTEVDGVKFSLSSFGIVTGNYTENGKLHINGDSEDTQYSDKTNQLRDALEKDPEKVGKALSDIMSKFYNTLTKKMSATSLSSALTLYNDKQIKSQTDEYEKQISSWETRLTDMEDRYYKQFSTMEKYMADLQSKQSQLSGMLGM